MTARIIPAADLFHGNRALKSGNFFAASQARRYLKDIALTQETDLTVANVASRMAKPVTVYTPPTSGNAA